MCNNNLKKAVNIPNPLFQSLKGEYFVGQTEIIRLRKGKNAWGGLINPVKSDVHLYVNAFTVTNFSDQPFIAEIWFNSSTSRNPMISNHVTPANTSFFPLPQPKVKIAFAELVEGFPKKGINPFKRIVPPNSTLASDEDGKFIFSPGGSFVVFLVSPSKKNINAQVAFGWFENNNNCQKHRNNCIK